jgi:DNA-binding response OmpR family regulator
MITTEADSILVIEDVPKVRALVARTLSDLPYRVVTADSVRSAKDVLAEIDRIRMLVVDFALPDGSGLEIVVEARKRKPGVPILLMSGVDVGQIDVDFIQKPFDPEDLLDRVASMAG